MSVPAMTASTSTAGEAMVPEGINLAAADAQMGAYKRSTDTETHGDPELVVAQAKT